MYKHDLAKTIVDNPMPFIAFLIGFVLVVLMKIIILNTDKKLPFTFFKIGAIIYIIIVFITFFSSCVQSNVVVIDGCQYIQTISLDGSVSYTHKGNCYNHCQYIQTISPDGSVSYTHKGNCYNHNSTIKTTHDTVYYPQIIYVDTIKK